MKNSCLIVLVFTCLNLSAPRDQDSLDRPGFQERLGMLEQIGGPLSRLRSIRIEVLNLVARMDTGVYYPIPKFFKTEAIALGLIQVDSDARKVTVLDPIAWKEFVTKLRTSCILLAEKQKLCFDELLENYDKFCRESVEAEAFESLLNIEEDIN